MRASIVLPRCAACLCVAYTLFVLWMAAELLAVLALALALHGGLAFATAGDRPLEQWPVLRRLF